MFESQTLRIQTLPFSDLKVHHQKNPTFLLSNLTLPSSSASTGENCHHHIGKSENGTVVRDEVGLTLDKVGKEVLGQASKVVLRTDTTTIVGDGSTQEVVNKRVAQIRNLIEAAEQEYEKKKLNERIAKLSGGLAVIQVGAQTETEVKEKKLRVEDALNATKAVVEEGIVVGGGCTLLRLASKNNQDHPIWGQMEDYVVGREKHRQLLLMFVNTRQIGLRDTGMRPKISSDKWEYVRIAFFVDPIIALSLAFFRYWKGDRRNRYGLVVV